MNTLVVEWEGTYSFKEHAVISNKFSYSRQEIRDFISYCEKKGIQVIPLQQSLGHVVDILPNLRYSILKEDRKDISKLCPMQPRRGQRNSIQIYSGHMALMYCSHYIDIGGDGHISMRTL